MLVCHRVPGVSTLRQKRPNTTMDALAPDIVDPASSAQPLRPLRAAVLVDLAHGPEAGGHVKCWEHLSAAALGFQGKLDLTLFFMGPEPAIKPLGENVRYAYLPPVFSTERVPFLSHVPDHTDLASFHPALARQLTGFDLIHTTDAYFAYARTAMRVAAESGIPLVTSIHTNTPHYARIFTEQTVERMFGHGLLRWVLLHGIGVQRYAERRMLRQLMLHQRACAAVLVSRPDQLVEARVQCGGRASLLRRGIDCTSFHPEKRDRAWLAQCYGVPQDRIVVLFTGRVNRGKNVMLLADRIEALLKAGAPVHLFCAGEGDERARIRDRLGPNATLPGHLDIATLARVYASADLFAFPSPAEEYANVVLEALASGLPVLVARESGMDRIVAQGETGFALPLDPPAWTEHLGLLVQDGARRSHMSAAARRFAERLPGWSEVLAEDLLPRWQRAVMAMRDERRDAPYPLACAAS
jgi:glycosyltransferase involved in cell wall biosynthesis